MFSIVYFGMANTHSFYLFIGLFFIYGIYAAATEGISKAWISNISDKKDTATAIGMFSAFQSLSAMLASTMAGIIWYKFGASAVFITTGIATLIVILYVLVYVAPLKK